MNYNRVILGGNITREPDIKTVGETKILEFGLAVSRAPTEKHPKPETDFFELKTFGRLAECIYNHFDKGDPILVEGRLQLEQWEKDGERKSRTRVIVETFQFVGAKRHDHE
jgi:single-strand DNA-binding protein